MCTPVHCSPLARCRCDAVFSGASAVLLTLGAGALAPLLSLPEALLRETGLFLIAYALLVGWLGTRQAMPKPLVVIVIAGNAAWTLASIALLENRGSEEATQLTSPRSAAIG